MNRHRVVAWIATLALLGMRPSAAPAAVDHFAEARALFGRLALEESLPHFASAIVAHPDSAEIWAWLAETNRRLGRSEDADHAARRALTLDPCHAFALTVLGDNSNPQYGEWPGADPDSSWHFLNRATACDSSECGAWLGIVIESMHRDQPVTERVAYRALARAAFFTPSIMAYARWMADGLPDSTLLVVSGDMDYYPLRLLQETAGFRRDVEIVNVSMLDLPWYRQSVCRPGRLPYPFADPAVDPVIAGGAEIHPGRRVVAGWCGMVEAGTLGRALALAITLDDPDFTRDGRKRQVLHGPFWRVMPDTLSARADTVSMRRGLTALRPEAFAAPWVSARDRSPVRAANSYRLAYNPLAVAGDYHRVCVAAGRASKAGAMKAWALDFARRAKIDPETQAAIEAW